MLFFKVTVGKRVKYTAFSLKGKKEKKKGEEREREGRSFFLKLGLKDCGDTKTMETENLTGRALTFVSHVAAQAKRRTLQKSRGLTYCSSRFLSASLSLRGSNQRRLKPLYSIIVPIIRHKRDDAGSFGRS